MSDRNRFEEWSEANRNHDGEQPNRIFDSGITPGSKDDDSRWNAEAVVMGRYPFADFNIFGPGTRIDFDLIEDEDDEP